MFRSPFQNRSLFLFRRGVFFVGDKFQHAAVDAKALIGWGVEAFAFENVAEMAVADGAAHFGAGVSELIVGIELHVFGLGRVVK